MAQSSAQHQRGAGFEPLEERALLAVAPLSDAFVVNSFTAGNQQTAGNQSVAIDAAGNFVVVWQSQDQDGDGWGVYGQRFDAEGQRHGEEFRVNTTTAGDQASPALAMNASGQFVVAWLSLGQDGDGWGIFAQRYGAEGLVAGTEFRVNGKSGSDQESPVIDDNDTGDFVVGWVGSGGRVRRFLADGSPAWPEKVTNDPVSIGIDGVGNISVASIGRADGVGYFYSVWDVRRYAIDGGELGPSGSWSLLGEPSVYQFAIALNESGRLAAGGWVKGLEQAPRIWRLRPRCSARRRQNLPIAS